MKRLWLTALAAAVIVAAVATTVGLLLATAQTPQIKAPYVQGPIPLNPDAPLWTSAKKVTVSLAPQMLVYPTSTFTGTRKLEVAAVYNGTHIALLLEWPDPTKNVGGIPGNISGFPDAVAVQFPVHPGSTPPYICMGDSANPVNIVMWKAGLGVQNLVAGSAYGKQPGERTALGMEEATTSPVETLPPQAQIWTYNAVYENGMWKVVLIRPLGSTFPLVPTLKPGESVPVAFAQWQGSLDERGGDKAVSGWYTLTLEPITTAAKTTTVTVTSTVTKTATSAVTSTATSTVTTTVTTTVTKTKSSAALKGAVIGLAIALGIAIIVAVYEARRRAA